MNKNISVHVIKQRILWIRGQKVMLDSDLAELYEVETKYLIRQVQRNLERFPRDFMFQLNKEETLRCQIGTSKRGGRRYLPYVFSEHGIAMLSGILNSPRAIAVNIAIMRAFIKLRAVLAAHRELSDRLNELEKRMNKKDHEILALFDAIRSL